MKLTLCLTALLFGSSLANPLVGGSLASALITDSLDNPHIGLTGPYNFTTEDGLYIEVGTDYVKHHAYQIYPELLQDEALASTSFSVRNGAYVAIGYYAYIDQGQKITDVINFCSDPNGKANKIAQCVNNGLVGLLQYGLAGYYGAQVANPSITVLGMAAMKAVGGLDRPPAANGPPALKRQSSECYPLKEVGTPSVTFTNNAGVKMTAINDCPYNIPEKSLAGWQGTISQSGGVFDLMQANGAWAVQMSLCTLDFQQTGLSINIHMSMEITTDITDCEDPVSGQGTCSTGYSS